MQAAHIKERAPSHTARGKRQRITACLCGVPLLTGDKRKDGPTTQGQAANIRAVQEGLRQGLRGRKNVLPMDVATNLRRTEHRGVIHSDGLGLALNGFLAHLFDQGASRLEGDAGEPLAALVGHATEVPNALQQLTFRPLSEAGVVQRAVIDAFGRESFDPLGATALDTLLAGDADLHDAIAELAGVEATVLASHLLSPRRVALGGLLRLLLAPVQSGEYSVLDAPRKNVRPLVDGLVRDTDSFGS